MTKKELIYVRELQHAYLSDRVVAGDLDGIKSAQIKLAEIEKLLEACK